MHNAKPDACQHGKCGLRNHWKINDDPITTLEPKRSQDSRKTAYLLIEFLITE
jgi:hypothetical protein